MKLLMSSLMSPLVFSTALVLGACGGPDAEPEAPAAAKTPNPAQDASTQPVPLNPLPVPPGEVRPPPPASEPGAGGG